MSTLKNAIVLVIDGLHGGFSGAYGNSGIATPALDRFACDSLLCDQYYTNTLEISRLYREFWYGLSPQEPESETPPDFPNLPARLLEKGYRTILLTDDPEIAYNLYADGFSEVHRIDSVTPEEPVSALEETRFFRLFATAVDLVSQSEQPYFLWVHLKAFCGPWDFPVEYREEYREEGDPEPYSLTAVPHIDYRSGEADVDPDDLRSVEEAYIGGVTVLDESLAGFLESLQQGDFGDNTLCIFTASRGFSLGEHGLIGPGEPGDLWAENLHLPLLVRLPEQSDDQRMLRTSALLQPNDIYTTLAEWFAISDVTPSEDDRDGASLFCFFTDEETPVRDRIDITGDSRVCGVMQPDWFFRVHAEQDELRESNYRVELFAKPDDRYEINEVADRCEDIVEDFLAESRRLPFAS